ncbi:hypothetical protein [Saccharolobus caldissimus]|uniref:Uncharacterized protein n=1 Tax=Saccharolobus caldissimus TaxID=1702097 RepID=A0AAQ4CSD0_9CREN|nr:hypothetical protein [Saccharolobus caldissimus]BDB98711.1 hypothetical protein SACC_17280 [Saccharolobus caldissimus]
MNIRTVSNAVNFDNVTSNAVPQAVYPVILDNDAGIIIRFSERWNKIEYHEGRVIIYRNNQGNISILEVEYDE